MKITPSEMFSYIDLVISDYDIKRLDYENVKTRILSEPTSTIEDIPVLLKQYINDNVGKLNFYANSELIKNEIYTEHQNRVELSEKSSGAKKPVLFKSAFPLVGERTSIKGETVSTQVYDFAKFKKEQIRKIKIVVLKRESKRSNGHKYSARVQFSGTDESTRGFEKHIWLNFIPPKIKGDNKYPWLRANERTKSNLKSRYDIDDIQTVHKQIKSDADEYFTGLYMVAPYAETDKVDLYLPNITLCLGKRESSSGLFYMLRINSIEFQGYLDDPISNIKASIGEAVIDLTDEEEDYCTDINW
ncbi:hypothetical protein ACFSJY_19215 [Thalassotalea euphylliae]|uniref:hypothetical protein n=1 Tax=Thalassotalea euphylliae TaxID=1655234 RepID=UPI00362C45A2